MESNPNNPPSNAETAARSVSPPLPANAPPVIGAPRQLPPQPPGRRSSLRQGLAIFLSLFLASFLADAVVSWLDDSLVNLFNLHVLAMVRGLVFLLAVLLALAVYVLMGLTPMIPKRVFLPLALFNPAAELLALLVAIYFFDRMQVVDWGISLCQVLVGFGIFYRLQGGWKLRWPLVGEDWLADRCFSWRNLIGFLLANVFGVLPAVLLCVALCAALAVNHLSGGFVALRPGGLAVQVQRYVRGDGKSVELVPMVHVADRDFYQTISQSFPPHAVILMEGVTDDQNLLTNHITYHRMATSLGLAEQQKVFEPPGEIVPADVDVDQFSRNTLDLLNLVMLIHARGVNADTLRQLTQYAPPPHIQEELYNDLVTRRNRHLLGELQTWLAQSENIVVPWGAGHMPGIAKAIERSGFHLVERREYYVIRFHHGANQRPAAAGKKIPSRSK